LSNVKNVDKLVSKTSSSPRKISGGCAVDPTVVVASPVDAIAPLASESDKPVIPNAGTALLRRLLFFEERFDMAQFSRPFGAHRTNRYRYVTFRLNPGASVKKVRNRTGAADCGQYRQG
jgi:hypothetical protein